MVWCVLHPQASTESLKAHSLLPPTLTLKYVHVSYNSHSIQRLFPKTSLLVMETHYFLWGTNYIHKYNIAELRAPKDTTSGRFNESVLGLFVNATSKLHGVELDGKIPMKVLRRLPSWLILGHCCKIRLERQRFCNLPQAMTASIYIFIYSPFTIAVQA